MNEFIKKQQELAREVLIQADVSGFATLSEEEVNDVITQIITNTGEELLRRVEGGRRKLPQDAKEIMGELGVAEEKLRNFGANKAIDTSKQHITSLTGVE